MAKTLSDPYLDKTFGNVHLDQRIGQGGMGVVYRGYHNRFDRMVAVKLLPPHHDEDRGRYQERFLREGKAAAMIQHRHVVQVFDAGRDHGIAYLTLDYIDGGSIGELLDERTKLPPETVTKMAVGIAEGLAAIHAKEIVHRDIKPDNILLTQDGQPKITDLGLARQLDDDEVNRLTATGMVVGTPLYVAPEAIRDGKSTDAKADVYSLGATLYHMLAGRPPFSAKTPYEIMRAHLEQRVRPLREIDPNLPRHLTALIELCLSKEPDERPSAREVVEILRRGLQIRRRSAGPLAVLSVLLAVVIAGLGAVVWNLLGAPGSDPDNTTVDTGSVILPGLPAGGVVEWRIDPDADWQPVADGRVHLPPGSHELHLRGTIDGALVTWHGPVTVALDAATTQPVALTGISVTSRLVSIPGNGVVYQNGRAIGDERAVPFNQLGTFAVGRWSGRSWQAGTVVVRHESAEAVDFTAGQLPTGPAWYRAAIDGAPAPAHHVLCWLEVERMRVEAQLNEPFNWSFGANRPFDPAQRLDVSLVVTAIRSLSGIRARLPSYEEALSLSDRLRHPLWYVDDRGRVGHVGSGSEAAARLLIMPAK